MISRDQAEKVIELVEETISMSLQAVVRRSTESRDQVSKSMQDLLDYVDTLTEPEDDPRR